LFKKNVGLIGLGIIGTRVAAALRSGGWRVYVWNRSPRAEAGFVGSAAEVAEQAGVIQLFVSDGAAVMECIEAMAPKLTPGHVVMCHATIGKAATLEAAARVAETGAAFLDAPFTGTRGAAEQRALCYFIGGDDAVLARVDPVLRASAKAVVKIGGIGDAAIAKLATNLMVGATGEILAEAAAFMGRHGLAPWVLALALEHHGVRSGLSDLKLPAIAAGDFTPHFALKHMLKDIRLGLGEAGDLELPVASAVAASLADGLGRGWGDLDFSVVARRLMDLPEAPAGASADAP
jgi:3-hydroxyisobutyrate dehydrogenase-like beta-hydroxyacid dehydrogenase